MVLILISGRKTNVKEEKRLLTEIGRANEREKPSTIFHVQYINNSDQLIMIIIAFVQFLFFIKMSLMKQNMFALL